MRFAPLPPESPPTTEETTDRVARAAALLRDERGVTVTADDVESVTYESPPKATIVLKDGRRFTAVGFFAVHIWLGI